MISGEKEKGKKKEQDISERQLAARSK